MNKKAFVWKEKKKDDRWKQQNKCNIKNLCTCIKHQTDIWMTYQYELFSVLQHFTTELKVCLQFSSDHTYYKSWNVISFYADSTSCSSDVFVISVIVQTIVSPLSLNFILSPVHVALFQQCQSHQCGLQAYREISLSLSLSFTFPSMQAPPEAPISRLTFIFPLD